MAIYIMYYIIFALSVTYWFAVSWSDYVIKSILEVSPQESPEVLFYGICLAFFLLAPIVLFQLITGRKKEFTDRLVKNFS